MLSKPYTDGLVSAIISKEREKQWMIAIESLCLEVIALTFLCYINYHKHCGGFWDDECGLPPTWWRATQSGRGKKQRTLNNQLRDMHLLAWIIVIHDEHSTMWIIKDITKSGPLIEIRWEKNYLSSVGLLVSFPATLVHHSIARGLSSHCEVNRDRSGQGIK